MSFSNTPPSTTTKKRKVATPDGSVNGDGSTPSGSAMASRRTKLKAAKRGEELIQDDENPEFQQLKSKLYHQSVQEIMSTSAYNGQFGLFKREGPRLRDIDKDGDPNPLFLNADLPELRRKLAALKEKYDPAKGHLIVTGQDDAGQLGLVDGIGKEKLNGLPPTVNQSFCNNTVQVAAGGMHSACLKENGSAYTWGCNDDGALGRVYTVDDDDEDSEERNYTTPTKVTQLIPSKQYAVSKHYVRSPENECDDVIQVAAGSSHTCFLTISGNVYIAGFYKDLDSGKFCDLRAPDDPAQNAKEPVHDECEGVRRTPVHIYQLDQRVQYIAAGGSFNAAVMEDDSLVTWGMGHGGELARSKDMTTLIDPETGGPDLGHPFYREVKDGKKHFLKDVVKEHFLKPKPVIWADGSGTGCIAKKLVTHVSCGLNHLLVAARSRGDGSSRVYSAGTNNYGKLGHGDERPRHELTMMNCLEDVPIERVAAGTDHSLMLNAKGDMIYACGQNPFGQLGVPRDLLKTKESKLSDKQKVGFTLVPMIVAFPTTTTTGTSLDKIGRFVDIQAGEYHSIAITSTGKIYTWGYGEYGQCGNDPRIKIKDITQPRLNEDWLKKDAGDDLELCVHCASGGTQHSLIVASRYKKNNN